MGLRSKIVLLLGFYVGLLQAANSVKDCETYYGEQQWEQALMSCQTALENNTNNTTEIMLMDYLAYITQHLGDNKQTLHYDQLIEQHPAFKTTDEYQYKWHRRKGRQYVLSEQYEQSKTHYNEALIIANNQKNILWQSKLHNDLGVSLKQEGHFLEALNHYQQSLVLKLKIGDDFIIGNTQYNIGHLLLKLERPKDAVEYLNRAIDSFQKLYNSKSSIDQDSLQKHIDHVY